MALTLWARGASVPKDGSQFTSALTVSIAWVALLGLLLGPLTGCSRKATPGQDFSSRGVQGVRFDPSYYYGLKQPLPDFVDSAVSAWQARGINTVFFKAYDPEFGAVYKTRHEYNAKTDYADKDLLRHFLDACHRRGISLIAWLPVFEHKGAWEAHPDWRMKTLHGDDFLPSKDHHVLCVRQEGFKAWWMGFLDDLLERYPEIDGVDFAEPSIVWRGKETCHCGACAKANTPKGGDPFAPEAVDLRAQGLTDLLLASSARVQAKGRIACVTFIATADPSTDLLPFSKQKELTGIDLDRLLDSPDRPRWISAEVMWQQWADTYDNPASFRPAWTRKAVEQALAMTAGRAHMLAHVEITPLGPVEVSPTEFIETVAEARRGGAQSIEFYDTHLADSLGAWSTLEKAWREASTRKAVVVHDPGGLGAARQVAALFGHFGLETKVAEVDSFRAEWVGPNDLLAYAGTREDHPLPREFLEFAGRAEAKVFWIDHNLGQLDRPLKGNRGDTGNSMAGKAPSNGAFDRLGFRHLGLKRSTEYPFVRYKGQELFKSDSTLHLLAITDSAKARAHAFAARTDGSLEPYIIQSGNFWYVADCPADYIEEGGRDLAFADLLHDFVGESHPEKRTALVRIEDVCPLTDPAAIRSIADYLHGERVPFTIALVPFYVDPAENVSVSLSDKPDLVKAIKHAVSRGAAVALHGSTHQYRGRSTHDFEFWDALHGTPVVEDSREYVRQRIQRGMDEMRRNGIYPVLFETPHYAASQLDYEVIDRHFSHEYGRRQVIDQAGFDQLVPYYIARHPSGTSIIPENLGYVPNDNQSAGPLLRFARNNLAVRDGFASFFFHPWIDRKALKGLVEGIKDMGYAFSDIRSLALKAQADGITVVTGSQEAALDPKGRRMRTFFADAEGGRHEEWVSSAPVDREFRRAVECPPGWTFVAETVEGESGWLSSIPVPGTHIAAKAREGVFKAPAPALAKGSPARPLLLWSSTDRPMGPGAGDFAAGLQKAFPQSQSEWLRAFHACGIDVDTLQAENFQGVPEGYNLAVIPSVAARQLSTQQTMALTRWVGAGHAVLLEGPSLAAEQMGLRAADSGWTTSEARDDYLPGVPIKWPGAQPYFALDADPDYVNLYSADEDRPLVASGAYEKGRFLFFTTPYAAAGASHKFPFLLDMIQRELALEPAIKSPSLEVYFDPGSREEVPIEDLAAHWKRNGVRAVYLAGWHDYQKYTFEYAYAVDLIHKAGMLAYAWIEFPMVSDRFWQEHPAWREKTAAGKDAEMDDEVGWKQYMNLTNDTCRAGAFNAWKRLLMMAPWDGAVLTGRMFLGDSPADPARVTPFHPSFRAEYKAKRGYDPLALFDAKSPRNAKRSPKDWAAFLAYRDSTEQALTAGILEFLGTQRALSAAGTEIILTRPLAGASAAADSLYRRLLAGDPRFRLQASAARLSADAATLEEDVTAFRQAYPSWRPMAEVSLERQAPRSAVTPQLAGLELMDMVSTAARLGVRLSLRTEDYIYDTDFRNLAYAAGSAARERFTDRAWNIVTPGRTALELDAGAHRDILVDGKPWPAYDRGRILLPAGTHRLEGAPRITTWQNFLQAPARVSAFNGSFTEAATTLKGLRLRYRSEHPAALTLNMPPVKVLLDGLPFEPGPTAKNGSLRLPAGDHLVEIDTRTMATSLMRRASVGLSVAVICISALTVLAFGALYLGGWLRRLYAGEPADPADEAVHRARLKEKFKLKNVK